MKKLIFLIIFAILTIGIWQAISLFSVSSFKECAKAGYSILETYPAQCKTPDGRTFTQQVVTNFKNQNTNNTQFATFNGEDITFQHPKSWHPTEREGGPESIGSIVHLGIPGVESDQEASFTNLAFSDITSNGIAQQGELIVDDRSWIKWIRKGNGYVSYDYYTTIEDDDGFFSIHVTVGEENEELEQQLDALIHTLTFK